MTTWTSETAKSLIRARAEDLGFDACGFTSVTGAWPAGDRLAHFIAEGRHGAMTWLAATAERRVRPTAMWPQARSAVVLGVNYGPSADPLLTIQKRDRGAIAAYAQGRDYHDIMKGRLKTLASEVCRRLGGEVKVFVDTAPLMEKPLAERAGLGWQGKHTNLVSEDFGSWLLLGSILTTLDLEPDEAGANRCGSCRACLDICPTGAFVAPYQLDARACISYLTIEHAGPVPIEFRPAIGNRVFGCDDCLAVCPWNKFASKAREAKLHPRQELDAPALADLAALDDAAFRVLFAASSVKRIGRDRFVRNVLYAIGNSGQPTLTDVARARLSDASEVVRDAAAWAVERLSRAQARPTELGSGNTPMSSILKTSTAPGGMGPAPAAP